MWVNQIQSVHWEATEIMTGWHLIKEIKMILGKTETMNTVNPHGMETIKKKKKKKAFSSLR